MPATMTRSADRWMISRGQIFESRAWQVHGGIMSVHFFAKEVSASAATVVFGLWGLLGVVTPATAQVETAVEYGFVTPWDYGYSTFFVTWFPDEIAALDAGAFDEQCCGSWQRTGATFNVWSGPESG